VTTERSVGYVRPSSGVLTEEGAEISVASLPAGGSVLRIDGLVLYAPGKPDSERVPADVHRLVVAVTPEKGVEVVRTVSSPRAIARVIDIVNRLRRPPYLENPGGPMITEQMAREDLVIRFYGGRQGADLLASVDEHPLLGAGTGNVLLWVAGKRQPILQDGTGALARAVSQLAGVPIVS
jgi:hypothetical protein